MKIEVLFEHNAEGLYGEDGVEGVHLVKRLGEADETHYDLPIDGFFLAIGHTLTLKCLAMLSKLMSKDSSKHKETLLKQT